MKRFLTKQSNGFFGNEKIGLTRYNYTGILTNNRNYFGSLELASWEPPSDWLRLPDLSENDQRFVGLLAVIKGASGNTGFSADSNFVAMSFAGNYIVDWGTGVTSAHTSGSIAQYRYNWENLPNSTLTSDGFKQVIIQAYPQAGATFTTMTLNTRYTVTGITLNAGYVVGWLDAKCAGRNFTSVKITDAGKNVLPNMLKRFEFVGTSNVSSFDSCFNGCVALEKVLGQRFTENATSLSLMFANCNSLSYVDLLDTRKANNMSNMFNTCYVLTTIPPLDTSTNTTMSGMFQNCYALKNIPMFNTSKVTSWNSAFLACRSLKRVPDFDYSAATSMSAAFQECWSLQTIDLSNTTKNVTNMNTMFLSTLCLNDVKNLDTSSCTSMSQLFNSSKIMKVSFSDTSKVQNAFRIFFGAGGISEFGPMSFASCVDAREIFGTVNQSIMKVGPLDFTGITTGSTASGTGPCNSIFAGAFGINYLDFKGLQKSINISNQVLSAANLNYLFENLADVTGTGATITITNNWGVPGCCTGIATSKGWTVVA